VRVVKQLTWEKDTKGTVVYGDGETISVYLQKADVNYPDHPQEVKMIVNDEEQP